MYKETRFFFMFSLIVMIVFGYGVRAHLLAPQPPVGGPILTSHAADGNYEGNCIACHQGVEELHLSYFGTFENDSCLDCHGGAAQTPHDIEGQFADCLSCHGGITASHDEMFPFPGRSYEDCLICHIPSE
ncbi:hypothetical protein [Dethiobacter alkaliphilus]|uniref:Uncharacterized protein n=1 Tax=Dethiobacter alkaliphilus AHT 1 TaxID=555088 RepID=C0GG47_DETAL|nr:hypothetical protein [Dethiobacter alkaliphilus]EEG77736.1 hypothetical protein DealDRAFT_1456 [Dethiobacter alkaliphilus AHT 1]